VQFCLALFHAEKFLLKANSPSADQKSPCISLNLWRPTVFPAMPMCPGVSLAGPVRTQGHTQSSTMLGL